MASPVYFFPRVTRAAVVDGNRLRAAFFEERGVAAAFAGVHDVAAEMSCYELPGRGPGGHSGLIVHVLGPTPPTRIGFASEHQTWIERPAGCDCWVGLDSEFPPTPADLAIAGASVRGYPLTLGDGQVWRIPILRSPTPAREQLPFDFVYAGDGSLQQVRRETRLWELAGEAWNHLFDRERHPTIRTETILELCLGALALQYRVGRVEQTVLRLVNSENWSRCLELLLDVPLLEEHEQKKTAESPPA